MAEPIGEPPPADGEATRRGPARPVPPQAQPSEPEPASEAPGGAFAAPERRQPRSPVFRQDLVRPAGAGDPAAPAPAARDRASGSPSGQQVSSALDALAAVRSAGEHDQAPSARGRRRRRRRS
ncbi:MAG: hypothetical protein KY452_10895 [Actinobacteria bacterium]|nr:hypothetical protein [Actinomycetota bacterium]